MQWDCLSATMARQKKRVPQEFLVSWNSIAHDERAAFAATVEREKLAVLEERELPGGWRLPVLLRRAVDRQSITRALVAHGLLHFRRRLIPPHMKSTIEDNVA